MEIEFKKKYSLVNGNKINKNNWHKVVAICLEPNISIHGVTAIDSVRISGGQYFCRYKLVKEEDGYIFREINANTGINGHHETYRLAIFRAISSRIRVILELD